MGSLGEAEWWSGTTFRLASSVMRRGSMESRCRLRSHMMRKWCGVSVWSEARWVNWVCKAEWMDRLESQEEGGQ